MQYFLDEQRVEWQGRNYGRDFTEYRSAVAEQWFPNVHHDLPTSASLADVSSVVHDLDMHSRQGLHVDGVLLETIHDPAEVYMIEEEKETRIDIVAGNRPGSLLEMTQCITELGLCIKKALVLSDEDWFCNNFWVSDPKSGSGRLEDARKRKIINQVMALQPEAQTRIIPGIKTGHTILELSGRDRPGLLADVTQLMHDNNYGVCSLAVWTQHQYVAFVLSVEDNMDHPTRNPTREVERLKPELLRIMAGGDHTFVQVLPVQGPIHHDRRLHKLLHRIESRALQDRGDDPSRTGAYYSTEEPPEFTQSWVSIKEYRHKKCWMIHLKCRDRMKLAFDVACALADLDVNVLGASIKAAVNHVAEHYYYVRPRWGQRKLESPDPRAMHMHDMLTAAVSRRNPPGVKLHMCGTADSLARAAQRFKEAGLTITRAKVEPFELQSNHTLYLLAKDGRHPTEAEIAEVCDKLGGQMTAEPRQAGSLDSGSFVGPSSFTYHLPARLDRIWHGAPGSSPSSLSASTLGREAGSSAPIRIAGHLTHHTRHFG